MPEGEARKLLAENLGVSEKNVYSQVRAIGNDLAGAVTFLPSLEEHNQPSFRILEEEEEEEPLQDSTIKKNWAYSHGTISYVSAWPEFKIN